jgi:hypothetical protein
VRSAEVPTVRVSTLPDDFSKRNATATRGLLCLNGEWQRQKVADLAYSPFSNPNLFPTKDAPIPAAKTDRAPSAEGWEDTIRIPYHAPQALSCKHQKEWNRRTVVVPAEWKGRRVELMFMAAGFEIVAYVNGKCVGSHIGDTTAFTFDITDQVNFGESNEIVLSVWWHYAMYGEVWPQGMIETIWARRTGVWDDVFLRSMPSVHVENVFCKPSARKQSMSADVTLKNASSTPASIRVESVVIDAKGQEVLKLPPQAVSVPSMKTATVTLSQPWPAPHLWWPDDPYLYYLETRVTQNDQLIDVQRERFGFCETWISGRDFVVNGKIQHFHCVTHDPGTGIFWDQDPAWIRAILRQYKSAGYTMVRTFAKPSYILLEAADEIGIYLKVQSGWHHSNNPLTDEFKKNTSQIVREWITRDRNHPSVVMWDASNEPDGQYESVFWVMDQIASLDPTRPIDVDRSYGVSIYNWAGRPKTTDNYNVQQKDYGLSKFQIANPHYPITCGLPCYSVLTAAEYPARWMAMAKIPLFFGEWGDFVNPGRVTRGPQHYADISELRELVWFHGFEFASEGWLTYLEEIMPHWRRWRVSGYDEWLSHTSMDWMRPPMVAGVTPIDPVQPMVRFEWDRLDTPGIKCAETNYLAARVNPGWFPKLPEWPMDASWQRYRQIWRERVTFFADKTRAIYGGRTFSRELTLINDSRDNQTMEGRVVLAIDGKDVQSAEFKADVPQGDVRDVPVALPVPSVASRVSATVRIELKNADATSNTIPLTLDVFPETPTTQAVASKPTIALYDVSGETAKAFHRLGIAVERIRTWPKEITAKTIVIGENSLDTNVVAESAKLKEFVDRGGQVVCLAQDVWRDWLPVKLRLNNDLEEALAYSLADAHPLLVGVGPRDFTWWPNNRKTKLKVPGRVVQKPFFKPTEGPTRSLIECGNALDLSGLIEVRQGQGVYYLTQMRMATIIGESPVADQLLRRLVTTEVPSQPTRTVWFAGDDVHRAMLTDRLGAVIKDLKSAGEYAFSSDDLIAWMPGEKAITSEYNAVATKALSAGAAMLAVAAKPEFLPTMERMPTTGDGSRFAGRIYVFQTAPQDEGWTSPKGKFLKLALVDRTEPLLAGLSNAELYRPSYRSGTFRLAEVEIEAKNGWRPVTTPGVIAVDAESKSPRVVVTVLREGPPSEIVKYERMIHELLVNLGGVHRGRHTPSIASQLDVPKEFFSIDLRPYCTMGFIDEISGDGKGGWGDQGPQNDLRSMTFGKQTFLDVPFDVIDPATNNGKSCVVLGSAMLTALPREVKGVEFGHRMAKRIYFLHGTSWAPPNGIIGEYTIHYGKALQMKETLVLTAGKNIADWYAPADVEDARVAWRGENSFAAVGLYMTVWDNPHPDTVIDEIDFVAKDKNAIIQVVAITASE